MSVTDLIDKQISNEATWISHTNANKTASIRVIQENPTTFTVFLRKNDAGKPCTLDIKNDDVIKYENIGYRILSHEYNNDTYTLIVEKIEYINQQSAQNSNSINVSGNNNSINVNTQGNNSTNKTEQTIQPPATENIFDILVNLWEWLKNCPLFKKKQ